MSNNVFAPRVYSAEQAEAPVIPKKSGPDRIGQMIQKVEQYLIVALMFLIPVFFVPGLPASLGFDKAILVAGVSFSIVILAGLSALRYTSVTTVLPRPLAVFGVLVVVALASGLLSGDVQDTLRGSVFETQTVGFLALMALLMITPLVLQGSKIMSLKAILALGASSVLLLLYTLVRTIFGGDFLQFGSFGSVTLSPVGNFNDLAIIAALTVIVSLITLLQLPLKKSFQIGISVLTVFALAILALVNFFNLWLVVGFFGLLLLVYIFSRDTLFGKIGEEATVPVSPVVIGTTLLVCVVSILFVIAGDYLGGRITAMTQVNYIEVRPSFVATLEVARGVYGEDVLLGTGPNRFADAWRLHKDRGINETIFWATDFNAGFGFIPTLFVTLGVLGGIVILVFHGLYLYLGYRMLLRSEANDPFWYYFGVVTFIGAAFLWGISYVYVPGAAILLLTALLTGLSFVAYRALVPSAGITIALVSSRKRGFLLMSLVIVVITLSVSGLFTMGKQYVAQAEFTRARMATSIEEFQQFTQSAFTQFQDDIFASTMAQSKLSMLQSMLAVENPSTEEQERFVSLAVQARQDAELAIALDPSNPGGHAVRAAIFGLLAAVGFEDAESIALGSLEDAKWRDPLNPSYALQGAFLATQLGQLDTARERIANALTLKTNFSEALFLSSQIDVQQGNVPAAIETTQRMVTLEPDNPSRYYQLGVLLAANREFDAAVEAYETAIQLDQNFANARYMLALTFLEQNRLEDALTQLRIVRETNQDNQELNSLISQLETGGIPPTAMNGLDTQVNEAQPGTEGGEAVTSPTAPDTDLISPVNTAPSSQGTESEQ